MVFHRLRGHLTGGIYCLALALAMLALPCHARADLSARLGDVEKKLPEVRVQETVISVSPKMRFYLPSGSFDLALKQEYRKTAINFTSRYDFVDNFMGFNLDFLFRLSPLSLGVNLNDTVDFSEILADQQYLQRSQYIAPYAQLSVSRNTYLRSGVRFENTYTNSVTTQLNIDQGRNIVGELGVWNDDAREVDAFPYGGNFFLRLQHSFSNFGSDYDYTQAELGARRFVYPFKNHFLEYELQAAYPVTVGIRPLTLACYAGGYRLMRGYRFKEFKGDAMIYNALSYSFPLARIRGEKPATPFLSLLTWDCFVEAVKIGDRHIYGNLDDIKASAGTGVGYRVVLFHQFPVRFDVSVAKAFSDRPPLFYFTLSTIYYTWRNQ